MANIKISKEYEWDFHFRNDTVALYAAITWRQTLLQLKVRKCRSPASTPPRHDQNKLADGVRWAVSQCREDAVHGAKANALCMDFRRITTWKINGCNLFFTTIPPYYNTSLALCSVNFSDNCFQNRGKYEAGFSDRLLLRNDAVPTLMGFPGSQHVSMLY